LTGVPGGTSLPGNPVIATVGATFSIVRVTVAVELDPVAWFVAV
jgi:hypothetical protein